MYQMYRLIARFFWRNQIFQTTECFSIFAIQKEKNKNEKKPKQMIAISQQELSQR